MKRVPYNDLYHNIHKRWNLPKDAVSNIIDKYDRQLIDEILDETPFTISKFFMDNRDKDSYCYDILMARIVEDLLVLWFECRNCVVEKYGSDADGIIHRSHNKAITTKPDLKVNDKLVEVQFSKDGKRKQYNIKDGKAKKILSGNNILMFVVEDEYFIVDDTIINLSELKPNPLWGGKLTYFIDAEDIEYKKMEDKELLWL